MKIFSAAQVRAWDAYTIAHEPVSSIDLMERAAAACTDWILRQCPADASFFIACGKGNNGGDGLAIARLLHQGGRTVSVLLMENGKRGSNDFEHNLQRLHAVTDRISCWQDGDPLPSVDSHAIIIDALFGTGLSGPLRAGAAVLVEHLNGRDAPIVSIDLPSGLLADAASSAPVIKASATLTFGAPKVGLLLQEAGPYVGSLEVLDIGLSTDWAETTETPFYFTDEALLRCIFRPRDRFAHKGKFGHALLAAGAYGKMGAAVLAARACLRTGPGLLSLHAPRCGYHILQSTVPEAMLQADAAETELSALPEDLGRYAAIGIGPGIGTEKATVELLDAYLSAARCPMVLDADALNILSRNKEWLQRVKGSILTPHPKEFDRLFGTHDNDFARMDTARRQAAATGAVILLKGHHTFIATPGGMGYFNSSGNAGMAKGGSGDVLTGILTALLAQGYPTPQAAVLGVWLHGKAANIAAEGLALESMLPSDLVENLGAAYRTLYG